MNGQVPSQPVFCVWGNKMAFCFLLASESVLCVFHKRRKINFRVLFININMVFIVWTFIHECGLDFAKMLKGELIS